MTDIKTDSELAAHLESEIQKPYIQQAADTEAALRQAGYQQALQTAAQQHRQATGHATCETRASCSAPSKLAGRRGTDESTCCEVK